MIYGALVFVGAWLHQEPDDFEMSSLSRDEKGRCSIAWSWEVFVGAGPHEQAHNVEVTVSGSNHKRCDPVDCGAFICLSLELHQKTNNFEVTMTSYHEKGRRPSVGRGLIDASARLA